MDMIKVLWVDLRFFRDQVSCYHYLNSNWIIARIHNTEKLYLEIRKTTPTLLCFEYDYPDTSGLSALRQTSCQFPSIPIIMLTEQHSEALATWALRLHVWDYFVRPLNPRDLLTSAAAILAQKFSPKDEIAVQPQLTNPVPAEVRFRNYQKKKSYPAQFFVESHYHLRINEAEVAQLCGMSISTFSRRFKKEHGMTFRDYLISYRINKAKELLQNPHALVTDIAYTVGFQDPSYFTRTFRRMVGVSPTYYREVHKPH